MDTVHVVISEIRKDVNSIKMYYVCSVQKDKLDELKNTPSSEFHGSFDTVEEAQKFMKQTTFNNVKEYTKLLHESGLPDLNTLLRMHSRYILAYLGNDLTTVPNVYCIPVYEFLVLKDHYPLTRLANLDEIINTNSDNSVVPMTQEISEAVMNLQLLKLQVSLSSDPTDLKNADNAYDEIYLNTFKMMNELQNGQTEKVDQLLKQLMPGEDSTTIEQVKTALNQIIQFAKAGREEGLTDLELEQKLFTELIHFPTDEQVDLPD